jgi:hypothetical protein
VRLYAEDRRLILTEPPRTSAETADVMGLTMKTRDTVVRKERAAVGKITDKMREDPDVREVGERLRWEAA